MKYTRKQMFELVKVLSTSEIKQLASKNFGVVWILLCAEVLEARMFSSKYGKQVSQ